MLRGFCVLCFFSVANAQTYTSENCCGFGHNPFATAHCGSSVGHPSLNNPTTCASSWNFMTNDPLTQEPTGLTCGDRIGNYYSGAGQGGEIDSASDMAAYACNRMSGLYLECCGCFSSHTLEGAYDANQCSGWTMPPYPPSPPNPSPPPPNPSPPPSPSPPPNPSPPPPSSPDPSSFCGEGTAYNTGTGKCEIQCNSRRLLEVENAGASDQLFGQPATA